MASRELEAAEANLRQELDDTQKLLRHYDAQRVCTTTAHNKHKKAYPQETESMYVTSKLWKCLCVPSFVPTVSSCSLSRVVLQFKAGCCACLCVVLVFMLCFGVCVVCVVCGVYALCVCVCVCFM